MELPYEKWRCIILPDIVVVLIIMVCLVIYIEVKTGWISIIERGILTERSWRRVRFGADLSSICRNYKLCFIQYFLIMNMMTWDIETDSRSFLCQEVTAENVFKQPVKRIYRRWIKGRYAQNNCYGKRKEFVLPWQ